MKQLFKQKAPRSVRAYKVEPLGKEACVSMKASKDQKEYVVCLCLFRKQRYVTTKFPSETMALLQVRKYKELYKDRT